VILSGGPASTSDIGSPRAPQRVFDLGVPVLGICYGQMTMCIQNGGKAEGSDHREFGRAFVEVHKARPCLKAFGTLGTRHEVWMSHGDRVIDLPDGFEVLATSRCALCGLLPMSTQLLRCHVPPRSGAHARRRQAARQLRPQDRGVEATGRWAPFATKRSAASASRWATRRVICGLSGGVDSSVAAVLIHEAIGEQLTCIFVDHGLMRLNEARKWSSMFRGHYNIPLVHVDASDPSSANWKASAIRKPSARSSAGCSSRPSRPKRRKLGGADFLAQGTLYPDVIESVSFTGGPSVTIKSHHNVGGLPERMNMGWSSRLRELFKDEVRKLGRELGLPRALSGRHPFPGPGLAIRCPGGITREKLDILRKADAIYLDEIRNAGLYDAIWQAFCGAAAGADGRRDGRRAHL
jgi:GMP synthase (glutamine-hydrolysing)